MYCMYLPQIKWYQMKNYKFFFFIFFFQFTLIHISDIANPSPTVTRHSEVVKAFMSRGTEWRLVMWFILEKCLRNVAIPTKGTTLNQDKGWHLWYFCSVLLPTPFFCHEIHKRIPPILVKKFNKYDKSWTIVMLRINAVVVGQE